MNTSFPRGSQPLCPFPSSQTPTRGGTPTGDLLQSLSERGTKTGPSREKVTRPCRLPDPRSKDRVNPAPELHGNGAPDSGAIGPFLRVRQRPQGRFRTGKYQVRPALGFPPDFTLRRCRTPTSASRFSSRIRTNLPTTTMISFPPYSRTVDRNARTRARPGSSSPGQRPPRTGRNRSRSSDSPGR